eukprot:660673-Rhodomonas_salina.1
MHIQERNVRETDDFTDGFPLDPDTRTLTECRLDSTQQPTTGDTFQNKTVFSYNCTGSRTSNCHSLFEFVAHRSQEECGTRAESRGSQLRLLHCQQWQHDLIA